MFVYVHGVDVHDVGGFVVVFLVCDQGQTMNCSARAPMFRQSFVVNIWTRRPTGIAQMTGADAAVFDEGSRIVASLDGGMLFDDLPVPAPEAPQTSGAVFRKVPLPNVGSW